MTPRSIIYAARALTTSPLNGTHQLRFESRWGRHPILQPAGCRQLHESQAGCSGSNLRPVERQSFREDRALDQLTLLQGSLRPQTSSVRDEVFGEPEDALDIELLNRYILLASVCMVGDVADVVSIMKL